MSGAGDRVKEWNRLSGCRSIRFSPARASGSAGGGRAPAYGGAAVGAAWVRVSSTAGARPGADWCSCRRWTEARTADAAAVRRAAVGTAAGRVAERRACRRHRLQMPCEAMVDGARGGGAEGSDREENVRRRREGRQPLLDAGRGSPSMPQGEASPARGRGHGSLGIPALWGLRTKAVVGSTTAGRGRRSRRGAPGGYRWRTSSRHRRFTR